MNLANLFNRRQLQIAKLDSLDARFARSRDHNEFDADATMPESMKNDLIEKLFEFGMNLEATKLIPIHPTLDTAPVEAAMRGFARGVIYAAVKTADIYTAGSGNVALATDGEGTYVLSFFGTEEAANNKRPALQMSLNAVLRGIVTERDGEDELPSEAFLKVARDMARYIQGGDDLEGFVYPAMESVLYGRKLATVMTVGPLLGLANGTESRTPKAIPLIAKMFEA